MIFMFLFSLIFTSFLFYFSFHPPTWLKPLILINSTINHLPMSVICRKIICTASFVATLWSLAIYMIIFASLVSGKLNYESFENFPTFPLFSTANTSNLDANNPGVLANVRITGVPTVKSSVLIYCFPLLSRPFSDLQSLVIRFVISCIFEWKERKKMSYILST